MTFSGKWRGSHSTIGRGTVSVEDPVRTEGPLTEMPSVLDPEVPDEGDPVAVGIDPLVLRVTAADAPGVVSWGVDQCPFLPDWVGTTPTFTLTARDDGGTDLAFTHHGLTPQLDCYQQCAADWDYFLVNHFLPNLQTPSSTRS